MEHTCRFCEQPKTAAQMAIRGGKPSKVCLECKQSRMSLGAGAPKKKAKRKAALANELTLSLPSGGFGVDASITEEGHLQLTQENDGATADNICLTRFEAKAIFEKFGEWIVES